MKPDNTIYIAEIEGLTHEAQGVARIDNKTVFIDGALPGERVSFRYTRRKRNFDEAEMVEVLEASSDRVPPHCDYFGLCGGCSFQHLNPQRQIEYKERQLLDAFKHVGGLKIPEVIPPLESTAHWGYRTKARLGAKWVKKKNRVLVGFREKRKPFIADMTHCEILPPEVAILLPAFSSLIADLSNPDQIPQIEVAATNTINAYVIRHMFDLTAEDTAKLLAFAKEHAIAIYSQRSGPDSISLLYPESVTLKYEIAPYGVSFEFQPTDFTQVNQTINARMVSLALELLQLNANDKVLELFSGLGNFSLPIANQVEHITAFEGDKGLVERATQNAARNGIANIDFHSADLFDETDSIKKQLPDAYNKLFLDPPRSGAIQILPKVVHKNLERIVYVSCNPATLARDAKILVEELGFKLQKAGVMDMFPQTSHVESIALFTR